jgi:hypothetical protein
VRFAGLIAAVAVLPVAACGPAARPVHAPRSATCDVSASWVGSAVDPSGVPWQLLLVLHHDGTQVAGTAEWTAEGGRFVEDVTGTADCNAGLVTLRTETATYRIELSADDATLTGRWQNADGQPGTLTATRKAQK